LRRISYPLRELIVNPSPSTPPLSDAEKILHLENKLQWAEWRIRSLEERLRMEMIRKYGPKSETLSDAQLNLLEREPGVSTDEVQAESERGPLPVTSTTVPEKKKRKHPGRQLLPAHLPRVKQIVPCPPEQCKCKACGKDTVVIGYEQSEQLDVKPAEYFVLVIQREKRACRDCSEGGVKAAPVPTKIIDKGLVSDRVVIDTIVSKYSDHLPLYRQSAILLRETGLSISRATMDGWVLRVGDLLTPVTAAIRKELVGGSYIQADETPVPLQMRDGRGKHHQAYLWQYGQPGGSVVFDFRLGRGREGPKNFLGEFQGILQTDGYTVYDRVGGIGMVHAACWAHSRRKVFDAVKLNPDDRVATRLVARIDELFVIDAEAREAGISQVARHALRQERSRPLLDVIKRDLEAAQPAFLPASALGKAISYTLSLWHKLTRFLEHPELELSNNLAENSMRPLVVGRKNWIHVGSEQAGPKVAAILSVIESCRRLKLHTREYLAAILPGLANLPVQRVGQFTPAAWAASRV
jgi:transposase